MSTQVGTKFGITYAETYGEVIEKWAKKLEGVSEIDDATRSEWNADLEKALGEEVKDAILRYTAKEWSRTGAAMPSKATIERYAQIAAKGALQADTGDLLHRLQISANTEPTEAITASIKLSNCHLCTGCDTCLDSITAAVLPGELIKRAHQTVSQIFDMAQDRFNRSIAKFSAKVKGKPMKRTWHTNSKNSRHAALDGQSKTEDEMFEYDGEKIYGPRPPGGSPANWSNCSCTLRYR